jgi:hypothetical protein
MTLQRPRRTSSGLLVAVAFASASVGCDKKDDLRNEQGAAPPPIASSRPGLCTGGGGKVTDTVSAGYFPGVVGDYCIDPNSETRAYGENAPGSVDKVCTELFDGECEVYKGFGLKRVVTLRYVDGKGSPGSVNVNLSRFESKDGAYAFFTQRVVADADPATTAPAKLEAGGAAALGTGISYVWRADHVAELSYTNDNESPDQLRASSARALPPIAKGIGEKMPGDTAPPAAVRELPEPERVPMGISYAAKDALGISGLGPGAIGFYKSGNKRWRVLVAVRPDEDGAKDVVKTLKKVEGAKSLKGVPLTDPLAFSLASESGPKLEWVVARRGSTIVGVGDEPHVLSGDIAPAEANNLKLTQDEKLEHVKKLAGSGDKPAPAASK